MAKFKLNFTWEKFVKFLKRDLTEATGIKSPTGTQVTGGAVMGTAGFHLYQFFTGRDHPKKTEQKAEQYMKDITTSRSRLMDDQKAHFDSVTKYFEYTLESGMKPVIQLDMATKDYVEYVKTWRDSELKKSILDYFDKQVRVGILSNAAAAEYNYPPVDRTNPQMLITEERQMLTSEISADRVDAVINTSGPLPTLVTTNTNSGNIVAKEVTNPEAVPEAVESSTDSFTTVLEVGIDWLFGS